MKLVTFFGPDGAVLLEQVEAVTAPHRRFLGLMGRRAYGPERGLYFPACRCIHTFFMRFPLDVIFVTDAYVVTRAVRAVKPGRVVCGGRDAYGVIEVEAGRLKELPEKGDRLAMGPSTA